jgi:hypothetical protein
MDFRVGRYNYVINTRDKRRNYENFNIVRI